MITVIISVRAFSTEQQLGATQNMLLACLSLTSRQDQCGKICSRFAAGGSNEHLHTLFLQTQTNIAVINANSHVTFVTFIQTGRKDGGGISSLVPTDNIWHLYNILTKWGLNCSKTVPWCGCDSNSASSSILLLQNVKGQGFLGFMTINNKSILLKLIFTVHICVSVGYLSHSVRAMTLKFKSKNKIFLIWTVKKNKTQQLNSNFSELLRRRLDIILSQSSTGWELFNNAKLKPYKC